MKTHLKYLWQIRSLSRTRTLIPTPHPGGEYHRWMSKMDVIPQIVIPGNDVTQGDAISPTDTSHGYGHPGWILRMDMIFGVGFADGYE